SAATEITYTGLSSATSNGFPFISHCLPCGRSYSEGARPRRCGRRLSVLAARPPEVLRMSCLSCSSQQVLARALGSGRVTEGLKRLPGRAVQVLRHLDVHGDQQVPGRLVLAPRPLAARTESAPARRFRGDPDADRYFVQRRDLDLGPKRRL